MDLRISAILLAHFTLNLVELALSASLSIRYNQRSSALFFDHQIAAFSLNYFQSEKCEFLYESPFILLSVWVCVSTQSPGSLPITSCHKQPALIHHPHLYLRFQYNLIILCPSLLIPYYYTNRVDSRQLSINDC